MNLSICLVDAMDLGRELIVAYLYRLGTLLAKKKNRLLVYLFIFAQHLSTLGRM